MPTKFFDTVRPKRFDGKTWYPLVCIEFFNIPIFLKPWNDAHEIFRHCETKIFRSKNVIRAFSSIKLFATRNFLKNGKIPLRNFSALWDKNFSTENCETPYYAWSFSIPQIFWNIEGMPTNFFGTVRQNYFDGKLWYPLLCIKIFRYPKFSKRFKGCSQNFSVEWDKNFWQKIVIPLIMHKFFRYLKFSETLKGCPQKFSALWDKKVSTEICDTP